MRGAKVQAVKDSEFYQEWAIAHDFCQACGVRWRESPFPGLSTHHIIKPFRSDEPCNLLRLCARCHDWAEHRKYNGVLLNLGLPVCLRVKRFTDPGAWDPNRLAELYGRPLPEEEPIPCEIDLEFRSRRPWEPLRQ